jgi:hypothetical protein
MSDDRREGQAPATEELAAVSDQGAIDVPPDRAYRGAAIAGIAGALLSIASAFMARFTVAGRMTSRGLLPGPGPGYAQRLAVNVLVDVVMPLVVLVACCMLLRTRSRKDRWSGVLLGGGLLFGALLANRLLAKAYVTGVVWFAGYWLDSLGYLIMFAAALMVGWTWFTTRTSDVGPDGSSNIALPPPPS